ncbi:MAG: hypothetical protein ACRDWX_00450 [Acidimicrobiia bacterium]
MGLPDYDTRHVTLPTHENLEPEAPADPLAMAAGVLATLDESTEITVGTTGRVAGRDVYTLDFRCWTNRTLVDRVEISVDVLLAAHRELAPRPDRQSRHRHRHPDDVRRPREEDPGGVIAGGLLPTTRRIQIGRLVA